MRKLLFHITFLVIILSTTIVSCSQEPSTKDTTSTIQKDSINTNYPYLNKEKNYLQQFSKENIFQELFDKIENDKKINIVHIGGSHIQAGIWTKQIEKRLNTLTKTSNGARGLLFPYHLAKTNNPAYYKSTSKNTWKGARCSVNKHYSNWNFTGISATSSDTLIESTTIFQNKYLSDTNKNFYNELLVYHDTNTSHTISLVTNTKTRKYNHHSKTKTLFQLETPIDSIHLQVKQNKPNTSFTLNGFYLENDAPGIRMHAIGVNGASTDSYLKNDLYKNHSEDISPDMVIFSIGINDAYHAPFDTLLFMQNYDTLITHYKKINPNIAIILTTNNDSYYEKKKVNPRGEIAKRQFYTLAQKHQIALWDMYTIMGKQNSITLWEKDKLAVKDKIHFTRKGYQVLGELFFDALNKEYKKYKKED